jgi:hypothetical protein
VIGLNKIWGVNLVSGFPCIVCFWVSLPADKILECSGPAGVPMVDDMLHLVFLLPFQKIRQGSRVIWSVFWALAIGEQKRCVKDVVDIPGHGDM